MIPFTTPKHTFRFGWSASLFTKVRIVYKQDDIVVLEKELNDCVVDGNSLILRLSQEDTAKFKNNIKAKVQVHYETTVGVVGATPPRTMNVDEILKREVL